MTTQPKTTALYLNERETAQRLGVSEKRWRQARSVLEARGLPAVDKLMGGRYWPAVKAFFDRRNGLETQANVTGVDGEENLDAL